MKLIDRSIMVSCNRTYDVHDVQKCEEVLDATNPREPPSKVIHYEARIEDTPDRVVAGWLRLPDGFVYCLVSQDKRKIRSVGAVITLETLVIGLAHKQ